MTSDANPIRFLSLFAGIGGMDLGLERAGMVCVGQVEIDPYCRAVLAKHWPNVPRMNDVREVKGDEFGPIDCIAGGVPCQPAAVGGRRLGAADARWLWPEFVRLVEHISPRWFLAENPRGILTTSDARPVFRALVRCGYIVRTLLLGARHLGAPHRRDRCWIVGYADRVGQPASIHENELCQAGREVPRDSTVGSVRATWPIGPRAVDQIPRMVDGLPRGLAGFARLNAFTALGNAVVPQVAEVIGRAIVAAHQETA